MANFLFTTPRRNEIFNEVVRLGLDPNGFAWKSYTDGMRHTLPRIEHSASDAFFCLKYIPTTRGGDFSLDAWPRISRATYPIGAWNPIKQAIVRWLESVKGEVETPDLWKAAYDQRRWLQSEPGDTRQSTPFKPEEREILARHLKTIEEYTVRTYNLNAAHQAHVQEQLEYLNEAASRVSRFDWKNLAASTFIDIVLTLGLDPDKAQKLLTLATQLLGPLVINATRLLGM